MNAVRNLVLLLCVGYAAVCLLVYLNQRNMMYFPAGERILPGGLTGVREVELQMTDGSRLYSWYRAAAEGQATYLFFHGNGGAIGFRSNRFDDAREHDVGLFMLGYPGYGGSEGSPSEDAFMEAAALAYDWLSKAGVAADELVIYGESIGTAVGVQLAAKRAAAALILEAPMTSTAEVAKEHYPYLPVDSLLKDRYESINHIAGIDMPLLVIHGDADQVIPIKYGRALFNHAMEPKRFVQLDGVGHNNIVNYNPFDIARKFLTALPETNQETNDVPDI